MRLDVPPSESDEPLLPANDLSNSSMKRIAGKSIRSLQRYAGLPLSVPTMVNRPVSSPSVDRRDVVLV